MFIFLQRATTNQGPLTDGEWVGGWRQKKSRDFNMVLFPSQQVIQYENEYINPFSEENKYYLYKLQVLI